MTKRHGILGRARTQAGVVANKSKTNEPRKKTKIVKVSFSAENPANQAVTYYEAEAATYEEARDAARAKVPEGHQPLAIRVDRG
ncbi:hypothetical protein [Glutamicibacter ardleyensis]|uniref:Uncharacterized protein n=1 Tax=Glutamicibacter ardleyensis TaxID=225894 RepID=A0ABQ2DX15_9MICC|nr:hypothetical protein [Glutamicibacter ardleyensis]GGJ73635.1 hypothetical protein GCM10007173_35760 [Glutamicibacter ardleyensis]